LNLLLLPVLLLAAMAGAGVNRRLIGGVTGDTLGAMVEVSEVILFLAIGLIGHYA
jgi:cobalamin synthase